MRARAWSGRHGALFAPHRVSVYTQIVRSMIVEEEQRTYSIALRLRRVTYEDAYVAVPVTDAILKMDDDGEMRLDFDRFVAAAIQIGGDSRVEWRVESSSTEAHPTQGPKPEDRKSFDAYYADTSG